MKTITASDTDKAHSLLSIMGLSTQMALSMGLHRDLALFPGVTPYYAEVRKRSWACLFRLNLDYSIRSGSHFGIRLEDVDCPLPSAIDLLTLDPGLMMEPGTFLNQAQEATDQAFSIAAMKLAIEMLQNGSELSSVAYHLLWTDIARAALTACLVVGRLRRINLGITVSNGPQPTLVIFQQLLLKYLDSLSQILAARYHLGPVAAKTSLVLAVATTVTQA
ncbi:hypothetical protein PDIDSM_2454 [Penicillium digitatum]|nr:hypothetical protein PDIDSM_2454 [Penicillium digitatum]